MRGGTGDGRGRALPPEGLVRVSVADEASFTWSCTPFDLQTLARGWLVCEGIASDLGEVEALEVIESPAGQAVEVRIRLAREAVGRLARVVASGASWIGDPYPSDPGSESRAPRAAELRPLLEDRERLGAWFGEMFEQAGIRSAVGGMHTGGLVVNGCLARVVEDVSRHHVVDRLVGAALDTNEPLAATIFLLSARISGAMAAKACRAGVAALVSRSVPTELAAEVAAGCGLTLVGRARREKPCYFWPSGSLS